MLFKLGFLENSANFIGKYLCWCLFFINFIKTTHQHRFFPMKFAKFQETLFLCRTPPMAASESFIIDVRQISAEAAIRRRSSKEVLLKISQYSQESTSVGDSF